MRQPKPELDITNQVARLIAKKDASMIVYTLKKKNLFGHNFDGNKITRGLEDVKNYSIPVRTWRYDGKFLFRRFISDMNGLKWRYEFEDDNEKGEALKLQFKESEEN